MLTLQEGPAAGRGGLDLVISLTADQADALGQDAAQLADALDTVLVAAAALRTGEDPVRAGRPTDKDTPATTGRAWHERVLQALAVLTPRLDGVQAATVRAHKVARGSYGALAAAMGVPRSTAQDRREDVLRRDPSPGELWATGTYGPVDHPGANVPANMRDWSVRFPAYLGVDITPPELRRPGLKASVEEGWAEPYARPQDVPDWPARQKRAFVPFEVDDEGRPRFPLGRTGRWGQNFGRFGEVPMADAVVVGGTGDERRVLLIRREDVRKWALPGGRIEPGESELEAMLRELGEEAGVDASRETPLLFEPRIVDDWRNTDEAWAVTTPGLIELEETVPARAGDDAIDVRWCSLTDLDLLVAALALEGGLYEPHLPILRQALDHILRREAGRA